MGGKGKLISQYNTVPSKKFVLVLSLKILYL